MIFFKEETGMRCPKCGYISFDHLTTCLNCSKDISAESASGLGTTYNVAPPSFLDFSVRTGEPEEDIVLQTEPDELAGELDVVDPDLEILIKEEEEEGIEFHSDDLDMLSDEFQKSGRAGVGESEESNLAVDLSEFTDASLKGGLDDVGEQEFSMSLPDELADISDLAPPPVPSEESKSTASKSGSIDEGIDFDMPDLDLKLDGLDQEFTLTSPDKGGRQEIIGSLSLDDIDISATPGKEKQTSAAAKSPAPAAKPDDMDMDADLNFELDLVGLSIPKK
jgi:hypothetical protein